MVVAGLLLTVGPVVDWAAAHGGDDASGRPPTSQPSTASRTTLSRSADTNRSPGLSGIPASVPTSHAATPAPVVAESQPLLVEAPGIGLTARVSPYTAADVRRNGGVVKPPTLCDVSWWTGGGMPGTAAQNTVYLYGHTWKEPAVFNRLKDLELGNEVYVTTARGRLRYVVEGSFTVPKPGLPTNKAVVAAVPGRLVLIGCYRETGHEDHTTRNIVITAQLDQLPR